MHRELQEKPPIDKQARTEARLRTAELSSYEKVRQRIERAELAAIRIFNQKTITVNGRTMAIRPAQKIRLYREALVRIFSGEVDVSEDAINQVRVMDRESE